jgi:uncharacterized alkaline shock family protein YloU
MSGYFENELGSVHISDEIVRRVTVPEIEAAPNLELAGRGRTIGRDVVLDFRDGKAVISLSIAVAMDAVIVREASRLQSNVKRAVELATGLDVATVNIRVERVFLPSEAQEEGAGGQPAPSENAVGVQ